MNIVWGIVLVLFTLLLCWLGQVINAFAPEFAGRIGLAEPEADVDRTFFLDGRGEAIWDALILWTLPVAGILLELFNILVQGIKFILTSEQYRLNGFVENGIKNNHQHNHVDNMNEQCDINCNHSNYP